MKAEQAAYKGIDIEIIQLILAGAGYCSEFIKFPSSTRGLAEFKKGLVDILPAASFSEERAQYSYFSEPYRNEKMRLFWYPKKQFLNADLNQLMQAKFTFAINGGAYYGPEFDKLIDNPLYRRLIVQVPKIQQRLFMLKAKRVDFMVDDEGSGRYLISQEKLSALSLHPYVVNDNPIHFMLNRKTLLPSDVSKINTEISNNKARLKRIIDTYFAK